MDTSLGEDRRKTAAVRAEYRFPASWSSPDRRGTGASQNYTTTTDRRTVLV